MKLLSSMVDQNNKKNQGKSMQWLKELPDKEREVIVRRFALDGEREATLEEIGDSLGLSKEAVRLKIQRLLRKLAASPALQDLSKME